MKTMTEDDVIAAFEKAVKESGSQSAFAKSAGVSVQFVNDVLRRRRPPSEAILDVLDLEQLPKSYRKKEKANA